MDGTAAGAHRRIRAAYVNVKWGDRLLFKYDPYRHVIEIQDRGVKHTIDLAAIDAREEREGGEAKISS